MDLPAWKVTRVIGQHSHLARRFDEYTGLQGIE